ncbi:hypothetical protein K431DRAFT_296323 [Polychaeton citri CBS 116435]|uniref:Uncharacterized protein n=1 Tax=Polychaeton citri CBS 116435 TaxID=1314669 RepID=A0A9P4Q4G5_9PEZI|nr:hypothetical protein K431DRAFT_296323 [Polychaeton citri CBS 116435]
MSVSKYLVAYAAAHEGQSGGRAMSYTPSTRSTPRSHAKGSYVSSYEQGNKADARLSDRGARIVNYQTGHGTTSVASSRRPGNRSYEASEVSRGRSRHRMPDNPGALQRYQPGMRQALDEEVYDEDDEIVPEDSISMVSSQRSARSIRSKHGSVVGSDSAFGKNTEPYYIRSAQKWVQVKRVRPAWT